MDKKLNSDDIIKLIKEKHIDDVVITECKDGPTWAGSHFRMDAWVMRKSWVHMSCMAYEVKVSRSDFLQDSKWHNYMDYCNEFSFVCPFQMIDPRELPDNVGLFWASKNGSRLFCKRKPAYRELVIPQTVFMYILMSRVTVNKTTYVPKSKKEFWEKWLEEKKIDSGFGYNVSRTLAATIKKEIEDVRNENERLKKLTDSCSQAIQMLKDAGIKLDHYWWENDLKRKITELKKAVPDDLEISLTHAQKNIESVLSFINKH